MFIEGENPAMSDPDAGHARQALAALEHLVVQDIFLTETAALADVVLPASAWPEKTGTVTNTDRLMQLGRPALLPPGNEEGDPNTGARAAAWILEQLAQRSAYSPRQSASSSTRSTRHRARSKCGAGRAGCARIMYAPKFAHRLSCDHTRHSFRSRLGSAPLRDKA